MSPERLLKHFEQISEAPDAVPRLRRFILDLAVRGKLVEQDPADEPAVELLKRIEKADMPYDIPPTWISAKAGRLLNMQYGKALPASDRSDQGSVPVFGSNGVVGYCETALSQEPAIIIGRKGSAGALNLCDGPSWTTDVAYFLVPSPFFNIRFLYVALQTLDLGNLGKGVKPGLSRAEAYQLSIMVPPLAEQYRIVAKVDELMALCHELEAAQVKQERRSDLLVAATLHGLNNGDASTESGDNESFAKSARFFFNHLPRLTTRTEHIQQLRQTILNLAVRGKLVPQDAGDEPAAELLRRIKAEKVKRAKEGKIQKEPQLSPINRASTPFALPAGWTWARFPELGAFGRGKSKHRPRNDQSLFEGGTHLLVQTGDVARSNGVIETFTGKYNDVGLAQSAKWPKGTLCITIAANIADSGILSFDACFPDSVVGFIPSPLFPNARYFEYFIRTAKSQLLEFAPATAQKNINLAILNDLLIPLPPFAEQHRIVASVDELMALCDELEARLTATATDRSQLLEAILHKALSPASLDNALSEGLSSSITTTIQQPAATKRRPNRHFARAVLSAEIVHQLHAEPTFGRTKHQKILHLCEHIAQIEEISGEYFREAAGPLDNRMIYSVEAELKKQRWYEEHSRAQFGHAYRPLEKAGEHRKYFERYWPNKLSLIQRLLDVMRTWDTDRCEIFSTTYAAWNDLLLWNQDPTEEAILKEVLERWHERKKRFSEERWLKAIAWMRKVGFTPMGFGKPTQQLSKQ